jgi:hypothetical protein
VKLTGLYLVLLGVIVGTGIGLFAGKLVFTQQAKVSVKSATGFRNKESKEIPLKVKESAKSNTEEIKKQARQDVEKTLEEIDRRVRSSIPDSMPLDSGVPVPKKLNEFDSSSDSLTHMEDSPIVILSDEITVRSEKLLGEVYAEIIGLEDHNNQNDSLSYPDSLYQEVSDIRTNERTKYKIQFWESPVNYSGYKMANNNVVVYGLEPADSLRIIKWSDEMFLDYQGTYYHLNETYDYKPLSLVTEEHLIIFLNESGN